MNKRQALRAVISLTFAVALASAAAAEYPEKAITLVVPYSAGGPTDKVARDFADALRKQLNRTVIIENSGGAGGNIGATKVARASPDGYTLLLHNIALGTANALYKNLAYKPLEDFEYLGMIADVPMTLIGRSSLKEKNVAELRASLAANPGKFSIGNAGIGSAAHLCGLMFQTALKADLVVVPYKGTANAMSDLLGGQIDLLCDQTTNTTPQIVAGTVKVFGVTSSQRLHVPGLADKPTLQEAGLPGVSVAVWHGLYAPRGTSAAVLSRLNSALRAVLKDPEFVAREQALGAVIVTDGRVSPAGHKEFVAGEIRRWTPLLQSFAEK